MVFGRLLSIRRRYVTCYLLLCIGKWGTRRYLAAPLWWRGSKNNITTQQTVHKPIAAANVVGSFVFSSFLRSSGLRTLRSFLVRCVKLKIQDWKTSSPPNPFFFSFNSIKNCVRILFRTPFAWEIWHHLLLMRHNTHSKCDPIRIKKNKILFSFPLIP